MSICLASSGGGHLVEIRTLLPIYKNYDHFYIINKKIKLYDDMKNKTFFITHAERNLKLIINLFETFFIFKKQKPKIIITTGASLSVPISIIGKIFFKTEIVYIETITRVLKPSLTGRIMYYLADNFFYQWENLNSFFPKGKLLCLLNNAK